MKRGIKKMGGSGGVFKNTFKILVHIFSELNIRRRDTGSFRQSTHKPPGAVCVAGLAVNQNKEHPLGCKSTKLLVERVLTTPYVTNINTHELLV